MAMTCDAPEPPQYPPELVQFVAEGAAWEADAAVFFLKAVGLVPQRGQPCRLPADFLLNLGAAMRLLVWEQEGVTAHVEAGLPRALEATRRVFLEAVPRPGRERRPDPWLSLAVFRLIVNHFAWTGRRDFRAEIRLDFPDEDALAQALAQFLWDHRCPAAPAGRGHTP
jgi:hypothetical protein